MLHASVLQFLKREMARRHRRRTGSAVGWESNPDQRIGTAAYPYLDRWFVIPKNRILNVYLHHFQRSDEDRALHDHPWLVNMSWILDGEYDEMRFKRTHPIRMYPEINSMRAYSTAFATPPLPELERVYRPEGSMTFRAGPAPHRVVLRPNYIFPQAQKGYRGVKPVWTLFITGPNVRRWGFYCPQGWVWWKTFVGADGMRGRGCD